MPVLDASRDIAVSCHFANMRREPSVFQRLARAEVPEPAASQARRPALTAPARDAIDVLRAGTKERPCARTKELRDMRSKR
jgi:hypothetical protein